MKSGLSYNTAFAGNDGLIINVANAAADRVQEYPQDLVTAGPADPVALAPITNPATETLTWAASGYRYLSGSLGVSLPAAASRSR
jgi:hypothetical protein